MNEENRWKEIVGPCYTAAGIADVLGWTEGEVATAGEDLRLLVVRTSDGLDLYPAFQLQGRRVVDGLQDVLRVLRTGTAGRWTWAQFLNVALPGVRGRLRRCLEVVGAKFAHGDLRSERQPERGRGVGVSPAGPIFGSLGPGR